jgi:hypothetical protein
MKDYRARLRAIALGRAVRSIGRNPTDKRMLRVAAKMLASFGGVDAFLKEWQETLLEARRRDPCGQFVKDSMIAVARLMEHAATLKAQAEIEDRDWLRSLPTEELAAENRRRLTALFVENSELAAASLRAAGWLVIPPAALSSAPSPAAVAALAPAS